MAWMNLLSRIYSSYLWSLNRLWVKDSTADDRRMGPRERGERGTGTYVLNGFTYDNVIILTCGLTIISSWRETNPSRFMIIIGKEKQNIWAAPTKIEISRCSVLVKNDVLSTHRWGDLIFWPKSIAVNKNMRRTSFHCSLQTPIRTYDHNFNKQNASNEESS